MATPHPASRKIYLSHPSRPDVRVPVREIALAGGNPAMQIGRASCRERVYVLV